MNSVVGYVVTLAAGLILSAVLFLLRGRRRGLPLLRAGSGFAAGVLLAFVCAKLVYVAFSPSLIADHRADEWLFAPEKISFVAGCAGFCLGVALPFIRQRGRVSAVLDAWAVPGCLMAAFARFAEIFLYMAGLADLYTVGLPDIPDGSLLARFPFAAADNYGYWYFAVSTLAAFLILIVTLLTFLRERKVRGIAADAGMTFCYAAFLLCCIRLLLELPRIESLIFYFVHVDQALAALVMIFLTVAVCRRRRKQTGHFPVWPLIALLLCFALNGLTQFLRDKPEKFESVMPADMYYWVCDHLPVFSYSVFLLTALLPVAGYIVLDLRLRARYRKETNAL